ncbi:hypothetical protein V9K97_17705 [Variovorax sp. CCNWLW186]|uniref:hypothetical protein n=1 Tax=Variovorax sp. CCNWLW186 TaxID=3127473 RepID=UPI0030778602
MSELTGPYAIAAGYLPLFLGGLGAFAGGCLMVSTTCVVGLARAVLTGVKRPVPALRPILLIGISFFERRHAVRPTCIHGKIRLWNVS